jgi:hypothetical protein
VGFFDRFKPKSDDAADLADRYAAATAERDALATDIAAMEARRGSVLVDASEAEAAAFEAELAEKRRQLGAMEAIAATLSERKTAAARAQRRRTLEARIAAAEAEAAAVAADLARLEEIAAPLLALLRREVAVCRAIAPLAEEVTAAARDGVMIEGQQYVIAPRVRLRPRPLHSHPGSEVLAHDVVLPSPGGVDAPIWPRAI